MESCVDGGHTNSGFGLLAEDIEYRLDRNR